MTSVCGEVLGLLAVAPVREGWNHRGEICLHCPAWARASGLGIAHNSEFADHGPPSLLLDGMLVVAMRRCPLL